MPLTKTPLRYPGGKSQLRPFVKGLIKDSTANFEEYIEPFCGGAGIAMELLLSNSVQRVWLNDLDAGIFSFWSAVVNETDRLSRWIEEVPLTIPEWDAQREVVRGASKDSGYDFELGAANFYMSRTNRSGVIRGGVIGGREQTGKYKMDCRFNKKSLVSLVRRIGSQADRIRVTNLNGADVISGAPFVASDPQLCLLYADPPYVRKAEGLYMNYFQPDDHEQLRDALLASDFPYWFATYDDEPLIRELYETNDPQRIDVTYSASGRRRVSELLIMSAELTQALPRPSPGL